MTLAAVFAIALPASAQETPADAANPTAQEQSTQTRERARIHVDGTEQQRTRQENRVNERVRNSDGTGQAQRARSQRQNRDQLARNAQRDMSRQLRDTSRSRAHDSARMRSRQHRTAQ